MHMDCSIRRATTPRARVFGAIALASPRLNRPASFDPRRYLRIKRYKAMRIIRRNDRNTHTRYLADLRIAEAQCLKVRLTPSTWWNPRSAARTEYQRLLHPKSAPGRVKPLPLPAPRNVSTCD